MAVEGLNARGVVVVEDACDPAVCSRCHAELVNDRDTLLSLPASMSEIARAGGQRAFLPFLTGKGALTGKGPAHHRRNFQLPIGGHSVDAVLRSVLSGDAGAILEEALGPDAELCGLTAISSEAATAAQDIHSDAEWSTEDQRLVTIFLAMHDILEEAMGPTRFVPETHLPSCFDPPVWLPPTTQRVAERGGTVWFPLRAGDVVVMDATTWHGGSANVSPQWRTILSISFVKPAKGLPRADGEDGKRCLRDFRT